MSTAPEAAVHVRPRRWSLLSVTLHWLIATLILVQLLDQDAMVDMWRAARQAEPVPEDSVTGGWVHIITGVAILTFTAVRLIDRFVIGRPAYPAEDPGWSKLLARIVHGLIWLILIIMPLAGIAAWFGGIGIAGQIHTLLWTPLLVLSGIHVLGALAQQYWFGTDVLARMFRLS